MSSAKRVSRRFSVIAVFAVVLVVLTTESAFAAHHVKTAQQTSVTPPLDSNCSPLISPGFAGGAIICFVKNGDHFYLKDTALDGHYVRVDAIGGWNTSESFNCEDHLGVAGGWTVCSWPKLIKDGSRIEWLPGIWEGEKAIVFGDNTVSNT